MKSNSSSATPTEAVDICRLFGSTLLYQTPSKDKWGTEGSAAFLRKIEYFVHRAAPVLFCLPAFPCRSSNPDKTAAMVPDGGEFEALNTLVGFCAKVRKIYAPGCVIDLVSDGHVFSGCIGVDDNVVTKYTLALRNMSQRICQDSDEDCVRFHNLSSVLSSMARSKAFRRLSIPVNQPVQTTTTEHDDKCRAVLLLSCRPSSKDVQFVVKRNPKHRLTILYAGFSRFMCEDLRANPQMRNSKSLQRRRIASKVALEMIQRNQAYSHLTELVMPRHVRLSIHAHDNSGPKFAVCLLSPQRFQTLADTEDLDRAAQGEDVVKDHTAAEARRHLHIPTPWHSVLAEVQGASKIFVCKASVVRNSLGSDRSPWHKDSGYVEDHLRGGRFVLRRKDNVSI